MGDISISGYLDVTAATAAITAKEETRAPNSPQTRATVSLGAMVVQSCTGATLCITCAPVPAWPWPDCVPPPS